MKRSIFLHWKRVAALLLIAFDMSGPAARAQDSAFTYQGNLAQNDLAYGGPVEMRFTLFNVASGGTAIETNAPPISSINVNNGLFVAALDFGVSAFNGDPRWLEIAVRTNFAMGFTLLTPRQRISATPYAITAREVTGGVAAAQLTGVIQLANIGVGTIHSNHLALGSIHSNHFALGSIHSNHLAVGSIHSNHFALGSIHSNHLAVGSIHSNHLAVGSIHSNHLALASIHSNHLTPGSIHSNHIAAGSIHSNLLALGSIHSNHLTVGSVSLNALSTSVAGSFSTSFNNPSPGFFTYFGISVAALGSDKLLVGAYQDSTGGDNVGAAYLLATNGTLLRTFIKPGAANQDHFGISVAAVGDKALIGADSDNTGAFDAGAAYLFTTNGTLVTAFTNPTPASSDFFGYSVAAVGTDKVLIGAYGDHFGANVGGAAYLFTTNRILLATFNNPTPASGDRFGIAVAAVGTDMVLIGADLDDAGGTDTGIAYLFDLNGTVLRTFPNPTPGNNDAFGAALTSVGSDAFLIGAPGDNSNGNAGGAAYLFNTSGASLGAFTNPTPATGDQFGISVAAVGGDKVLIGAASDNTGATDTGAAYLFSIGGTLLSTLNNPAPGNGDLFGNVLTALGPDKIVVGAPQDDAISTDAGAVHMFFLGQYLPGLAVDPSIAGWQKAGPNVYYNGGNVGIGTASPEATLQVSGNNSQLRLHDTARGNYWHIYTENHGNPAIAGNLLFFPGPTGTFGFIRKTDGTYFSGSDERLKKDIHGLGPVLDRVLQLRPVTYRFKSEPASARPVIGLIAQEVELLFPEMVDEHDGTKALAYSELVPVTVGAIQELNQKFREELQRRDAENAELKRSVDELRRMVNALSQKFDRGER